ncbi:MAG: sulfurtransferase complex subunit TusC [Pseudomonadales bacterium]|nr:sulfurtransferase complex subunit TusC [Pseudomonadales bacterium]
MADILFLLRQPPYDGARAIEALDAVFVAGVFEQNVSVLFKDDGVWQLVNGQAGDRLGVRTQGKVVAALPEYEVTRIYVCATSLAERHLVAADLVLPVILLDAAGQRALMATQQAVVND